MLESDSRPHAKKEDPGTPLPSPLPFVGREQDIEWIRETVGKSNAVSGCDLPCWCLRRTQKFSYEVCTVPFSQVEKRLSMMRFDRYGHNTRKSAKFLVVQGGSGIGMHMH